jgi:hypothetical protein
MRLARLLVAAICVVALSRLLEAQGASSQLESVDLKGSVGGVLDELAHMRGTGVRTKVIGLDTTDSSFIFPSAGAVQGAGGTYFRSDVMIVNHRSSTQRVSVGWIAQGVNNSNRPLQYFDLTANTPYILSDFVTNTIHQSGLGAILVTGVTSGGNADTNATLAVVPLHRHTRLVRKLVRVRARDAARPELPLQRGHREPRHRIRAHLEREPQRTERLDVLPGDRGPGLDEAGLGPGRQLRRPARLSRPDRERVLVERIRRVRRQHHRRRLGLAREPALIPSRRARLVA